MVRVVEQRLGRCEQVSFASGRVRPLVPDAWAARVASFRADGVQVQLIRARAMRFSTDGSLDASAPIVTTAVLEGRLRGVGADRPLDVLPGGALLTDSRCAATLWTEHDLQVLRVAVDRDEVPPHLLARAPMPLSVLASSPVLRGFVAFATTLLRSSDDDDGCDDGTTVARSMVALQLALLEESRRQHLGGGLDRRARIEAHIEDRLTDPDLSPATIAREFGISLRSVHAAFADSGGTVAATIRLRRVEAVQRALLEDVALPRLSELASAYGFSDRAHLARSFRDVTGDNLRRWWEQARRARN